MVWVKLIWSAESDIANLGVHEISFLWYICDILLCQIFFPLFASTYFFSLNSFYSGRSSPSTLTLPSINSFLFISAATVYNLQYLEHSHSKVEAVPRAREVLTQTLSDKGQVLLVKSSPPHPHIYKSWSEAQTLTFRELPPSTAGE